MPTPPEELIGERYHPCPNCPPVKGRQKRWRAAYAPDIDGNIHITYADTRNSKLGLSSNIEIRASPELAKRASMVSDTWLRGKITQALDALANIDHTGDV